jgi:hypothetical protein
MQAATGSEERLQALMRNSNTRLLAHPESRRRLLQLKGTVALLPFQGWNPHSVINLLCPLVVTYN